METTLTKIPAQNLGFGPSKKRSAPGADILHDNSSLSPDEAAKREIEHGTHQLETLLNGAIDKNFDIFELYVMRNILTVKADDQPYMQLAHYQDLDFSAPSSSGGGDAPPSADSVTQLRRRLHASQTLQVALETERVRNDALLATLRAALGVKGPAPAAGAAGAVKKEDDGGDAAQTDALGFLHDRGTLEEGGTERPITTTTEFTLAQLQTLRSLSSSLRTLLPAIGGEDDEDGDKDEDEDKSWRRQRAEYVESASRRYLETVAGVELGPAGEVRDGEWQGAGLGLARDEVAGLETVVAVLGAQQQQQQAPEQAEGGAGQEEDEDESMAQS